MIFDDLELITRKSYENVLLLLDYASSHGVIELDCSKFVESKESSTSSQREISIERYKRQTGGFTPFQLDFCGKKKTFKKPLCPHKAFKRLGLV